MSSIRPSETIERAAIEDTSLLAFYRDMNLGERRTFWACASGWALDGMDFQIYPLVIGTIMALWAGVRPALWEIFEGPILKTTILASLMATGCQGGYYAITFWVPRFLTTERKLSIVSSTGYLAALIIGSFIGYLVGAWLAARIGRRNLFLTFSIGAIAVILLYTQLPLTNEVLWLLGFPLGFFASGIFSGMGPFLTELFPTRIRGSGQGFAYNFGRGVASFNPLLVGLLSATPKLSSNSSRVSPLT